MTLNRTFVRSIPSPLLDNTLSIVQLRLLVVDSGTPTRGVAVDVNVTLSQTCLYDVLGDPTPLQIYVVHTGGLYLRIPKYYLESPGEINVPWNLVLSTSGQVSILLT